MEACANAFDFCSIEDQKRTYFSQKEDLQFKNVWKSDKSWEPEKIWKFKKFENLKNLKIWNLK